MPVAPPSFRLPGRSRIGIVRLQVSDLGQSIAFYEEILGLRARRIGTDTALLSVPGSADPLITLHTRAGIRPAARGRFGLYHFAILLPDRAALGRMANYLATQPIRVAMADHLVSEALYLWDPDGLGIEVYADRPRTMWQQLNDELVMATERLDVHDLTAGGGTDPWKGMPDGTTIGHVHLHVGDLSQAEAFFHRALGFDKTVWSYPGALFLSAGGYHHHVATNIWAPGPSPSPDTAQLIDWELIVPSAETVDAVRASLATAGFTAEQQDDGLVAADPWQTHLRVRSEAGY
jgi:catechol 2,3-dioxygenase